MNKQLQAVSAVSPIDSKKAQAQAQKAREAMRKASLKATESKLQKMLKAPKTEQEQAIEQANANSQPVRECVNEVLYNQRGSNARYLHIASIVPERAIGHTDEAYAEAVRNSIKPLAKAVWNSVASQLGIEPLPSKASDEVKKAYNARKGSIMKVFSNACSVVSNLAKADVLEYALAECKANPDKSPRMVMEAIAKEIKANPVELSNDDINRLGVVKEYNAVIHSIQALRAKVSSEAFTQLLAQARKEDVQEAIQLSKEELH